MTLEIRIEGDVQEMVRSLDDQQRRIVPAAQVSAINKTAAQVRTRAVRELARSKKLKARAVRKRFALIRATRRRPAALLRVKLAGGVPSSDLGAPRQTAAGARAGRHSFPGAFVATMPSGNTGVYRRLPAAARSTGRDSKGRPRRHRLPIAEVRIPLNPEAEQITNRLVRTFAAGKFREIFARELRWRLQRRGLL